MSIIMNTKGPTDLRYLYYDLKENKYYVVVSMFSIKCTTN